MASHDDRAQFKLKTTEVTASSYETSPLQTPGPVPATTPVPKTPPAPGLRGAHHKREFSGQDCSEILWLKGRALWKVGRALLALDAEAHELEAIDMVDEALKIHWDICGTFADEPSTTDAHWDGVVFFLYR